MMRHQVGQDQKYIAASDSDAVYEEPTPRQAAGEGDVRHPGKKALETYSECETRDERRRRFLDDWHFNKSLGSITYWQGTILPEVFTHPLMWISVSIWILVTMARRNEVALHELIYNQTCPTKLCDDLVGENVLMGGAYYNFTTADDVHAAAECEHYVDLVLKWLLAKAGMASDADSEVERDHEGNHLSRSCNHPELRCIRKEGDGCLLFRVEAKTVLPMGSFLVFFAVFYANQCYVRWTAQYVLMCKAKGAVLNAATICRANLEGPHKYMGQRVIRYMNAAHLLAYVGVSDDYTQDFFKSFSWEHRLFTKWEYETLTNKYPDFKAPEEPRVFKRQMCCIESKAEQDEVSLAKRNAEKENAAMLKKVNLRDLSRSTNVRDGHHVAMAAGKTMKKKCCNWKVRWCRCRPGSTPMTYKESKAAVFKETAYTYEDDTGETITGTYWSAHHKNADGSHPTLKWSKDGPQYPAEDEDRDDNRRIHVDINPSAQAMCREVLVWAFQALNAIQDDHTFMEVTNNQLDEYMKTALKSESIPARFKGHDHELSGYSITKLRNLRTEMKLHMFMDKQNTSKHPLEQERKVSKATAEIDENGEPVVATDLLSAPDRGAVRAQILNLRAALSGLYDYDLQPIPFAYFNLLSWLLLVYLPLFAYVVAQDYPHVGFSAGIAVVFTNLSLLGLHSLAQQLSKPFGKDELDFPVTHFLDFTAQGSRVTLNSDLEYIDPKMQRNGGKAWIPAKKADTEKGEGKDPVLRWLVRDPKNLPDKGEWRYTSEVGFEDNSDDWAVFPVEQRELEGKINDNHGVADRALI